MKPELERGRIPWMSVALVAIAAVLVIATCAERGKRNWTTGEVDDGKTIDDLGYAGDE